MTPPASRRRRTRAPASRSSTPRVTIPPPSVADYTPYVQAVTTSDGGKAPDAMVCLAAIQCIDMWTKIKAGGYTGTFMSALYDPRLGEGVFEGVTLLDERPADRSSHAGDRADADRRRRDQVGHADRRPAVFAGYVSADFFVQALKKAGANPTPGIGPEGGVDDDVPGEGAGRSHEVPRSHVIPTPSCGALDVERRHVDTRVGCSPYACTTRRPIRCRASSRS